MICRDHNGTKYWYHYDRLGNVIGVTDANGNAAATPLVDEAIRTDPGVYPSQAVLQKLYTFPDLDPKTQRTMTRSWTKIKSGR